MWVAMGVWVAAAPAEAKKTKVRHDEVVAPAWTVPAVEVDIGTVTAMATSADGFVLAGQRGIAGVAPDGAVRWVTPLPEAMVRNLAVDAGGVAFTAWTLAGTEDKAQAFDAWALGKLLDRFQVEGASVGYLGADGALRWQVDAVDQHPLAPPALTADTVVVNTGAHVAFHGRDDGQVRANAELPMASQHGGALGGIYDHATRGEVVPIGDALFTSFFSYLFRFDGQGALLDKEFMAGLTPYVDITCGPVALGELVVFGSTGDRQVRSAFFAMKPDMKNKWKTWSPDEQSGCGDLVVAGERVIASSNFWVMAIDDEGKLEWTSVNQKGGLYPSSNRGVRYVGNFATRKTYGDLLAVGGGQVFVASSHAGHDVVTVLDAADGSYLRTVDVNETIVSMAMHGDTLAVATSAGLRLLGLGS